MIHYGIRMEIKTCKILINNKCKSFFITLEKLNKKSIFYLFCVKIATLAMTTITETTTEPIHPSAKKLDCKNVNNVLTCMIYNPNFLL